MKLLVFIIKNCKDCNYYVKRVGHAFRFSSLNIKLYDVDDERNFLMSMNAVRKYKVTKMPSAVLLENGDVVCGSNQENMAYPSGLCAERVALFYCGANYPNDTIDTLCIVAEGELLPKDHLLSPCGGCRQVMLESENRQNKKYRVILVGQDERVLIFDAASDLLPFAFGNL
jgi:cytidine deaminase